MSFHTPTHARTHERTYIQIATRNNITRIKRCGQIMGRGESDSLTAAQIFYPCMQCNDVFMLRANITSLGMDQRKVNMLAREFAEPKNNVAGAMVCASASCWPPPPLRSGVRARVCGGARATGWQACSASGGPIESLRRSRFSLALGDSCTVFS
jgi:tryptophanyl-tRNA synthetase